MLKVRMRLIRACNKFQFVVYRLPELLAGKLSWAMSDPDSDSLTWICLKIQDCILPSLHSASLTVFSYESEGFVSVGMSCRIRWWFKSLWQCMNTDSVSMTRRTTVLRLSQLSPTAVTVRSEAGRLSAQCHLKVPVFYSLAVTMLSLYLASLMLEVFYHADVNMQYSEAWNPISPPPSVPVSACIEHVCVYV